jgi:pyruvate,water dikinase
MKAAELLAAKGVIRNREDIYYLYFDELGQAVKTNRLDNSIIETRKADYIHIDMIGYLPGRVVSIATTSLLILLESISWLSSFLKTDKE